MAVEHVLAGEELLPVHVEAARLDGVRVLRVATACRQQRDVTGLPSLFEEALDRVIGHRDRVVRIAVDPVDVESRVVAGDGLVGRQLREDLGDLGGVPQVLIQLEGTERDGGDALAGEQALLLIREDVQGALDLIAQARLDRIPPQGGEVLALVDDDRVEQLAARPVVRQLLELCGQGDLPVGGVVVRARLRAPADGQVVEEAGERGAILAGPLRDRQLQVPTQAARIAHERDLLPLPHQ